MVGWRRRVPDGEYLASVGKLNMEGTEGARNEPGALLYFFFFRTGTFRLMSALIECQSDGELSGAADRSVFPSHATHVGKNSMEVFGMRQRNLKDEQAEAPLTSFGKSSQK